MSSAGWRDLVLETLTEEWIGRFDRMREFFLEEFGKVVDEPVSISDAHIFELDGDPKTWRFGSDVAAAWHLPRSGLVPIRFGQIKMNGPGVFYSNGMRVTPYSKFCCDGASVMVGEDYGEARCRRVGIIEQAGADFCIRWTGIDRFDSHGVQPML